MFREIKMDRYSDVRISESKRAGSINEMIDMRKFELYPKNGIYDGNKKPTKGLFFPPDLLPYVITTLIELYEKRNGKKFDINEFKSH